jgi:hypothetical protein
MSQEMLQAWSAIRERVKQKVSGPTVYRALDALQLVTIEGETVVLGLPTRHIRWWGILATPLYASGLSSVLRRRMRSARRW